MTLGVVGKLVRCDGETATFGNVVETNIWLITGMVTSIDVEVPTPSTVISISYSSIFWVSFYEREVLFDFFAVIFHLTLPILKCTRTQTFI